MVRGLYKRQKDGLILTFILDVYVFYHDIRKKIFLKA